MSQFKIILLEGDVKRMVPGKRVRSTPFAVTYYCGGFSITHEATGLKLGDFWTEKKARAVALRFWNSLTATERKACADAKPSKSMAAALRKKLSMATEKAR